MILYLGQYCYCCDSPTMSLTKIDVYDNEIHRCCGAFMEQAIEDYGANDHMNCPANNKSVKVKCQMNEDICPILTNMNMFSTFINSMFDLDERDSLGDFIFQEHLSEGRQYNTLAYTEFTIAGCGQKFGTLLDIISYKNDEGLLCCKKIMYCGIDFVQRLDGTFANVSGSFELVGEENHITNANVKRLIKAGFQNKLDCLMAFPNLEEQMIECKHICCLEPKYGLEYFLDRLIAFIQQNTVDENSVLYLTKSRRKSLLAPMFELSKSMNDVPADERISAMFDTDDDCLQYHYNSNW